MSTSRQQDITPDPARRRVIAGAGAVVGLGALTALRPAPASAAAVSSVPGLPVVKPDADLAEALALTPQVQLSPGATYTLRTPVPVPSGALIQGNGAIVTTSDDQPALVVSGRDDVTIRDVRFVGSATDPINTAHRPGHVGVQVTRSTAVRVLDCEFRNWGGAGVVTTGSREDDYFAYRTKITGSSFTRCFIGVSTADRSEYGVIADNHFVYCRLAVWSSSGNWQLSGNDVVGCYGAYYSMNQTSPYGALASDNWAHGAVVGNTFNHSNGGAKALWRSNAGLVIGGVEQDPGPGIVVAGVLPPTFSGNTLWYTNVRGSNLVGTRWLLSGSTFSNLTITGEGVVPIILVSTQSNGAANAPKLVGNVRDALPVA